MILWAGEGETYRGSVANHLPLAVLGKDPQKYDVKISILEVEDRWRWNQSTSAAIFSPL